MSPPFLTYNISIFLICKKPRNGYNICILIIYYFDENKDYIIYTHKWLSSVFFFYVKFLKWAHIIKFNWKFTLYFTKQGCLSVLNLKIIILLGF